MKWFIFALLILGSFLQTSISVADTFNPPWKVIERNKGFEYWYDTSRIEVTQKHVSTYVWEVYPEEGRSTYKYIVFERDSGWWAYGRAKGYKGETLVTELDFAQTGYVFGPPRRLDQKLFNLLKDIKPPTPSPPPQPDNVSNKSSTNMDNEISPNKKPQPTTSLFIILPLIMILSGAAFLALRLVGKGKNTATSERNSINKNKSSRCADSNQQVRPTPEFKRACKAKYKAAQGMRLDLAAFEKEYNSPSTDPRQASGKPYTEKSGFNTAKDESE